MQTSPADSATQQPAMPYSRVLLPLDGSSGSERALAPARALVLAAGASLWPVSAAPASEALDRLGYLRRLTARLDVPYVQPEVLDRDGAGDAIESIACSYNRMYGGLIVCMSTHARMAVPEVVVGSTAAEVVGAGVAPVVLVGPAATRRWSPRNLVVCLDGSEFARAVLPMAEAWACSMGLGCWLVRCAEQGELDPSEESALRAMVIDMRRRGLHADCDVLHGSDAAEAIVDFAGTVPGALVTMTTHGRSARQRLTIGSTAVAVVRHSRVPVLVYHP